MDYNQPTDQPVQDPTSQADPYAGVAIDLNAARETGYQMANTRNYNANRENATWGDVATDTFTGIAAGAESFIKGFGQLADDVGEFFGADLFDDSVFKKENQIFQTKTAWGDFVSGTTDFMLGFIPVAGAVGKVSKLGYLGKGIATAASEIKAVSQTAPKLAQLTYYMLHSPLAGAVTDFVVTHTDADLEDSKIEQRVKAMAWGIPLGIAGDIGMKMLGKIFKAMGFASRGEASKANEEIANAIKWGQTSEHYQMLKKKIGTASENLSDDQIDFTLGVYLQSFDKVGQEYDQTIKRIEDVYSITDTGEWADVFNALDQDLQKIHAAKAAEQAAVAKDPSVLDQFAGKQLNPDGTPLSPVAAEGAPVDPRPITNPNLGQVNEGSVFSEGQLPDTGPIQGPVEGTSRAVLTQAFDRPQAVEGIVARDVATRGTTGALPQPVPDVRPDPRKLGQAAPEGQIVAGQLGEAGPVHGPSARPVLREQPVPYTTNSQTQSAVSAGDQAAAKAAMGASSLPTPEVYPDPRKLGNAAPEGQIVDGQLPANTEAVAQSAEQAHPAPDTSTFLSQNRDITTGAIRTRDGKGILQTFGDRTGGVGVVLGLHRSSDFATLTEELFHVYHAYGMSKEVEGVLRGALGMAEGQAWDKTTVEAAAQIWLKFMSSGEVADESLRPIFTKAAEWMQEVYRTASAEPEAAAHISPEVRSAMEAIITGKDILQGTPDALFYASSVEIGSGMNLQDLLDRGVVTKAGTSKAGELYRINAQGTVPEELRKLIKDDLDAQVSAAMGGPMSENMLGQTRRTNAETLSGAKALMDQYPGLPEQRAVSIVRDHQKWLDNQAASAGKSTDDLLLTERVKKEAKVLDIATELNAAHNKLVGAIEAKLTTPESIRSAITRFVSSGLEMIGFQLKQPVSGVGWYSNSIKEMWKEMSKLHPELASDEEAQTMFTLLLSIFSQGNNPTLNMQVAEGTYALWKEFGRLPRTQPTKLSWPGRFGGGTLNRRIETANGIVNRIETSDGGSGYSMDWLQGVLDKFNISGPQSKAELKNLRKWMLSEHSLEDIRKIDPGFSPPSLFDKEFNLIRTTDDPNRKFFGMEVLGPKIGWFSLNQHGVENKVTKDLWFSRTWNRIMGNLVEKGKVVEAPRSDRERAIMDAAVEQLTKEANAKFGSNLSKTDVQAILWFFEKNLYEAHGSAADLGSYDVAAKTVVDRADLLMRGLGDPKKSSAALRGKLKSLDDASAAGENVNPELRKQLQETYDLAEQLKQGSKGGPKAGTSVNLTFEGSPEKVRQSSRWGPVPSSILAQSRRIRVIPNGVLADVQRAISSPGTLTERVANALEPINVSRLGNQPGEAKAMMFQVSEALSREVDKIAPKMTLEEMKDAAIKEASGLDTTPEKLVEFTEKWGDEGKKTLARAQTSRAITMHLVGQAKQALTKLGENSPQYKQAAELAARAEIARAQLVRSISQALNSQKNGLEDILIGGKRASKDSVEFMETFTQALENSGGINDTGPVSISKFTRALVSASNPDAARQVMIDAGKAIKKGVTKNDIVLEYWINSLLSGVKTHVTNAISQTFMTVMQPAGRIIGGALGGDTYAMRQGLRAYAGLVHSFGDIFRVVSMSKNWDETAFGAASKAFWNESPILDSLTSVEGRKAITAANFGMKEGTLGAQAVDFAGKAIRMPSRFLTGMDELFKQLNYRAYLHAEAYDQALKNGIKDGNAFTQFIENYMKDGFDNLGRAKNDVALNMARRSTFTQEFTEGSFMRDATNFIGKHPSLRHVLPFVRVPTNVMRLFRDFTPGVNMMFKSFRNEFFHADPLIRADARGRAAMGAAFWITAGSLAAGGMITGGGPSDPNLRKQLLATGWRPYSFVTNNQDGTKEYTEFRRMEPVATLMGMAADYHEISQQASDDTVSALGTAMVALIAKNLTSKTYLASLSDTLDAVVNPDLRGLKWVQNRAASYVPAFTQTFNEDDTMREVRGFMDVVKRKLPGYSSTLPPKRDLLGEPVKVPEGAPESLGWLSDIGSPYRTSTRKGELVRENLASLNFGFRNPSNDFDGVDLKLIRNNGREAYDRYQELVGEVKVGGQSLEQALSKLFTSKQYKQFEPPKQPNDFDHPQVKMVHAILGHYRNAAKKQLLSEFPEITKQQTELRKQAAQANKPASAIEMLSQLK